VIELCRLENVEPPSEMVAESAALVKSLEIRILPAVPFSAR